MRIYLIRHGQTDWNIQGKIQGCHDIALNEMGRRQAKKLAEGMDSRPVSKIFSSTLKRARETAEMVGKRQVVEISLMPQLMEVEFGKWEGLTWDEIKAEYPREFESWSHNPSDVAPPGGETQEEIISRCAWAVKEILKRTNRREDVCIVSHGATLAHLVSYMMQGNSEEGGIIVENASITTLNYNPLKDDFVLLEINDTSHLDGIE